MAARPKLACDRLPPDGARRSLRKGDNTMMRFLLGLLLVLVPFLPVQAADPPATRVDSLGDPLPENALLRFGTRRFHHPGNVHELEVSLDDQLIATMGQKLIVWDAATGKPLWEEAPDPNVFSHGVGYGKRRFVFSPDSRTLYLAVSPDRVKVLDARTGQGRTLSLGGIGRLGALPHDHDGAFSVDINPATTLLAVGAGDALRVCDLNGNVRFMVSNNVAAWPGDKEMQKDRLSFTGAYTYGYFSPDGQTIAVATSDTANAIRLFDAQTGELQRTIELKARPVQFAFSKDSIHIAVSERDHTVRLYDAATGARVWEHPVVLDNPYENYTSSISYSTDGAIIAVGATDNRIYVLDAQSGARRGELVGHHWYPWGIAFSSDSRTLYSTGWEGRIRRWDARELKQLDLPAGFHATSVITISPDGKTVAFADDRGTIRVVDAETGDERRQFKPEKLDTSRLAFCPDNQRLALGGSHADDVALQIWNADTGTCLHDWHWPKGKDPHSRIEDMCFSPDGRHLATCVFRQSQVQIWDCDRGRQAADMKHSQVYGLSIVPDGKTLATAGWDRRVIFWDMETAAPLHRIEFEKDNLDTIDLRMYAVRFDPTGKRFATAHLTNGRVRIWDATTRAQLLEFGIEGGFYFGTIAWSPDGRWLATGNSQGHLALWNPTTGEKVADIGQHADGITNLGFGVDSTQLISGGSDGVGYFWKVPVPAP